MSLFQKSVEKKYLNELDTALIDQKYKAFQDYFGNAEIQENIRNSKEEQFQEGFLRELFVSVFGYTLNPQPNFNLTTELKNIANSKKADGAILRNAEALAVIELKGTDTTDLDSIEAQAFGYKNHHPKCVYVITSNFEKLRFYIQNAVDHIDFDLFNLTREQFSLMWLCLAKDSLLNDLPLKIKESSVLQEENITKKLYADYSKFREDIYNNLVKNNPETDKLLLFKKTQKLLDRFLFIFFAEDRLLLPPNSISEIVKQWDTLKDLDAYVPLYERFKMYFGYLNTGYKGKKYDIYAYNGGLFAPDELLDSISVDDDILHEHTRKLSQYDYETDVDVNILGHIFEHSLGEIENVQAEIKGETVDAQKTRRKKDGIFYTPKYITKYIVENTVGKLCEEKRAELEIVDEEYAKGRKNRKKETIKTLDDKLTAYRNWLLSLTILDPACGSGAFLNQALDFLITEHRKIDDLRAQLFGGGIVFSDITTDILEKNIYGVDLNEESVEIAKLSLWLRTAQKGRKLNKLNNNIKCGNSLIDDPEVAGEKAFNWQNEFPEIFKNGGFDVVIGNPPYVRVQGLKEHYFDHTIFYEKQYLSATGNYDIYSLFMEKSFSLINSSGIVSFILPHKFLISDFGSGIRSFFINNSAVDEIIHFGAELVFQDATTYTCIINLTKSKKEFLKFKNINPKQLFDLIPFETISYQELTSDQWFLSNIQDKSILDKIQKQPLKLNDVFNRFVQGIITGKDAVFCVNGLLKSDSLVVKDENGTCHELELEILKPHLRGEDISKYKNLENKEWLVFPYDLINGKAELLKPDVLKNSFPNTFKYLSVYEDILRERENGKFDNELWYQYSRNQAISVLEQPKIITPEVCFGGSMTFDNCNFYHNSKCHTLLLKPESKFDYLSILPLLNSSIFWFYLSNTGNVLRGGYIGVKRKVLEPFGVPNPEVIDTDRLKDYSLSIISNNKHFQEIENQFIKYLASIFHGINISKKLNNWYKLSFAEFILELKKSIKNLNDIKLSKSDEMEWMELFETKKAEVQTINSAIDKTDKEINQMVYELYGLTAEEIKIVEESI
ncbi:Type IIS restriction enzyme Eco57I [Salinivirga cyanobacteriivorans]|uniref:site-specific DNA-methyltransferase (adenine-specific) n=1 Tax=Salinivirga cyanobacteriivorans TaxID=1307839 RepID=A0A0S2I542_9BACT|nr:N-6 DNA methylase [Salinivirga cyanobacteriivorans]ALO17374.1 Type IIS restriction enzyme Eco57I [Salinivirga cyanobacteriivorans]